MTSPEERPGESNADLLAKLFVMGAIFIGWMLLRPPELLRGHEMSEDDLPEQLRHHGLEALPEHSSDEPPDEGRRRPPAH